MNLLLRILPILTIYFLIGFAAIDAVTSTFYVRDMVPLGSDQLIEIGIWMGLPWSIKLVFGSIIDNFYILGNNRKSYIHLGSTFFLLGQLFFLSFVYYSDLRSYLGDYALLVTSGLLTTLGIVFWDIIADTLSVDVARDSEEIGKVQVLGRGSQMVGGLLAALITGPLAASFEAFSVFSLKLVFPALVALSTVFFLNPKKLKGITEAPRVGDYRALVVAFLFLLVCVISRSQEVIVAVQTIVILYLLYLLLRNMERKAATYFVGVLTALFLFRAAPGVGPVYEWWTTSQLGFDQNFLGLLKITGSIAGVGALLLFGKKLRTGNISLSLSSMALVGVLTLLVPIAVYFRYVDLDHVRYLFIADNALAHAVGILSMIPLGIVIAENAPLHRRALYMSVTASFMNVPLVAGDILSKKLNKIFPVTRLDFSQLGQLLISVLILGLMFVGVGAVILYVVNRKRDRG